MAMIKKSITAKSTSSREIVKTFPSKVLYLSQHKIQERKTLFCSVMPQGQN